MAAAGGPEPASAPAAPTTAPATGYATTEERSRPAREEEGNNVLTPFLRAVRADSPQTIVDLVKTLGDRVLADLDTADSGMTCLHFACKRGDYLGKMRTPPAAATTAAAAATAKATATAPAARGGGSAVVVRLLLDSFGERPEMPHVDARDKQGFTPLHVVSDCCRTANEVQVTHTSASFTKYHITSYVKYTKYI